MSGIPKKLRQAIRVRRRAVQNVMNNAWIVGHRRTVELCRRVVAIDQYIQQKEWQRETSFDPIAMGM